MKDNGNAIYKIRDKNTGKYLQTAKGNCGWTEEGHSFNTTQALMSSILSRRDTWNVRGRSLEIVTFHLMEIEAKPLQIGSKDA